MADYVEPAVSPTQKSPDRGQGYLQEKIFAASTATPQWKKDIGEKIGKRETTSIFEQGLFFLLVVWSFFLFNMHFFSVYFPDFLEAKLADVPTWKKQQRASAAAGEISAVHSLVGTFYDSLTNPSTKNVKQNMMVTTSDEWVSYSSETVFKTRDGFIANVEGINNSSISKCITK